MDFETLFAKTPATLDVVSMPRTRKANWTINLRSVTPDAVWEASEIVADIQEAYDLAVAA